MPRSRSRGRSAGPRRAPAPAPPHPRDSSPPRCARAGGDTGSSRPRGGSWAWRDRSVLRTASGRGRPGGRRTAAPVAPAGYRSRHEHRSRRREPNRHARQGLVSRFVSRWPFADRLGEDLVRGLDPDERRGPGVPVGDEGGDRSDEFADAPEAAPPDGLAAENAEPRLDLVHPGSRGRREVEGDPRMALQPGPDSWRLVGADVVEDDVQLRVGIDAELHVILDNVSTHKTPAVRAWLEHPPR